MGQQLNKVTKRKRRLARVKRQKEIARDQKANPALAKSRAAEAKKAAPVKKKAPAKKAAAKKPAAKTKAGGRIYLAAGETGPFMPSTVKELVELGLLEKRDGRIWVQS